MQRVIYRAGLLDPVSPGDWRFHEDGGLVVEDGRIAGVGDFDRLSVERPAVVVELDGLVVPGFVDVHIHWVQHAVRGRFAGPLLRWIREHVWPEEARYGAPEFARQKAEAFFRDTVRAGTVLGMAYGSVHSEALDAAMDAMRGDWRVGNAITVDGAPDELTRCSPRSLEAIAELASRYGPDRYALTPRFVLTCPEPLMTAMGRFARTHGYFVQTHLSESPEEVAEVQRAFPDAVDYTDVLDRCGLLFERTVLGHAIHLSDRERRCLAARGAWVAHCPSSNEALDSGRMDLERARQCGIRFALASDVGAGPSHSMLHVMQRFLAQHQAAGVEVTVREALYRATLAGAGCLGRGREAGSLAPGKRADFVLLPRVDGARSPEAWLEELLQGSPQELEARVLGTWIAGVGQHDHE